MSGADLDRYMEFARTWEAERVVKQEWVGDVWVSTTRLIAGFPSPLGGPLWFETMAFPRGRSEGPWGTLSDEVDYGAALVQVRYETREAALAGHAQVAAGLRQAASS